MRQCRVLFEKLGKNKGPTGCWRFEKNRKSQQEYQLLVTGKNVRSGGFVRKNSVGYSWLVLFSLSRVRHPVLVSSLVRKEKDSCSNEKIYIKGKFVVKGRVGRVGVLRERRVGDGVGDGVRDSGCGQSACRKYNGLSCCGKCNGSLFASMSLAFRLTVCVGVCVRRWG